MHPRDFSLLAALDILLDEESVAGAAARMNLSTSAMSRILGRIRLLTGDPILVRAGRGLVPTPRAQAMRDRLAALIAEARALLHEGADFDPARIDRRFAIRATDGFSTTFGAALLARLQRDAPGIVPVFLQQGEEDVAALRDGTIDLDISVMGETGPEIMARTLFRDRFVGVVRAGHALTADPVTPGRLCAHPHISASRRGRLRGPLDVALGAEGYERRVVASVIGFTQAVMLAARTDLVAVVPERLTTGVRQGLVTFPFPLPTPDVAVSQAWHPRFQVDPGHRWLRTVLHDLCAPEDRPRETQ